MFTKWINDIRHPGTQEIRVAKGYCTPARDQILTALQPYGVDVIEVVESIVGDLLTGVPLYIHAVVRVRQAQAGWAEYLLLRSGHFRLLSEPVNRRNREWARRHKGVMPTPWTLNPLPWVEPGCKPKPQSPRERGSRK